MREFGFPNTYTFAKAIAEHLVVTLCNDASLEAVIVRPSIVGPSWAAPFAGWSGERPSTIVCACVTDIAGIATVYRGSHHALPLVPVDLVAGVVLSALIVPAAEDGSAVIMNATTLAPFAW